MKMLSKTKIKEVIINLDIKDKHFKDKIVFLLELLDDPSTGHIIDREMVEWCKSIGLKPTLNTEDGDAWWTCRA